MLAITIGVLPGILVTPNPRYVLGALCCACLYAAYSIRLALRSNTLVSNLDPQQLKKSIMWPETILFPVDISTSSALLPENLWGYGKRLRFVDEQAIARFGSRSISVLDVGCGNGSQLAIPLARLGYQVTGVDPHAPSIARARSTYSDAEFITGLVSDLRRQAFEMVILSEVLEHVQSPELLLAEALQYLAPKGLLVITVPNGYGEFELDWRFYRLLRLEKPVNVLSSVRRKILNPAPKREVPSSDDTSGHIQRFSLQGLQRMFARLGLKVVARRATSVASGALIAHTVARLPGFVKLNVVLADHLPMWASSGWMFALVVDELTIAGIDSDDGCTMIQEPHVQRTSDNLRSGHG
jgi:SAM-dependent methyltransferase